MKHVLPVLFLVAAAGVTSAQSSDQKRIEELEKRVKELEEGHKVEKPATDKPAATDDKPVSWKDLVSLGGRMKWYGFLRLDVHWSNSTFNDPRFPTFVRSEDDTIFIAGTTAVEKNDHNLVFSARLTRLGFDLDGGKISALADAAVTGKLEIDFFALPSSESRAVPRMRHAYGKVGWDWFYVLFGQTSDLVAPLWPSYNPDNVLWNWCNPGDRRPQLRLCLEPKIGERLKLYVQAMAGQQGAITNADDITPNGSRDGDDSGIPMTQGRFAIGFQHWVEKKWITLGFGVMYGAEETDGEIDGKEHFDTYMYCVDLDFPIFESGGFAVSLKGELFEGINLADIRAGTGLGINAASGQEIRSRGGWGELKIQPVKWYAASFGFGEDDPHDHEFPIGAREKNRVYYMMNTFQFSPFIMSIDIGRWRTDFDGMTSGKAWRYTLTMQVNF